MQTKLLIALLITAGLFIVFGINPFSALLRLRGWRPAIQEKKKTAGEFVRILEGKKKQNLVQRSLNDTKNSLTIIGQAQKYKRTVRFAFCSGAAGAAFALFVFSSPLLMVVLGTGCALIPLWLTNLTVYSYTRSVNDELETALSMITTAYTRHNDIVKAIEETVPQANAPVKAILIRFVRSVTFIDSNVESAIVQMKTDLDNTLFRQWCDVLLLCQSDHTLKAGLQPIVAKISELKAQQSENETQMMMPLQDIMMMSGIVCSAIPILRMMSPDWYGYLVHTLLGQVVMSITAIIIFASVHKAIKLSKPIDYKL